MDPLIKGRTMKQSTTVQRPFIKGFKFEIYPTPDQQASLAKIFGSCRWVWNEVLTTVKTEYQQYLDIQSRAGVAIKPQDVTGYNLVKRLPLLKLTNPWLYDAPADSLQQTMLQLAQAYSRFFKSRKGYPRYKSKHDYKQSVTLTRGVFNLKKDIFVMSKVNGPIAIGWGRNNELRELPSVPSSAVIKKDNTGRYWISFICEYFPEPTQGNGTIGIDLGLKDLAVLSTGERISNPRHYQQAQQCLRRLQQSLARKQKGSNNRSKTKLKLAQLHTYITNSRTTTIHQLTRRLVNENQVIGIEGLRIGNMVKNNRLSKGILDAGWGMFKQQLSYKARESQHCAVVQMDVWYPSTHICNVTQQRLDRKLKLSERTWNCPYCGQTHDRDLNAALNIRDIAIRIVRQTPDPGGLTLLATMD